MPLGVRAAAQLSLEHSLLNFLRPKRLLLVLDNREHLIEACAAQAARSGQAPSACRFSNAALAIRASIGAPLSPIEQRWLEQKLQTAATAADDAWVSDVLGGERRSSRRRARMDMIPRNGRWEYPRMGVRRPV
jgi:hypothetical protein